METNVERVVPARATHPGSILKRELQARGIKQKDFAKTIGIPAPNLSELIKGKRHISEAVALKLESVLGISYMTWMNLQNRYNYIMRLAEISPIPDMKKEKESADSLDSPEKEIGRFNSIQCIPERVTFELAERLREERKKAGLTQEQLAERAGIGKTYISRLENGKANVQLSSLFRIFEGLGRRVSFIVQ